MDGGPSVNFKALLIISHLLLWYFTTIFPCAFGPVFGNSWFPFFRQQAHALRRSWLGEVKPVCMPWGRGVLREDGLQLCTLGNMVDVCVGRVAIVPTQIFQAIPLFFKSVPHLLFFGNSLPPSLKGFRRK